MDPAALVRTISRSSSASGSKKSTPAESTIGGEEVFFPPYKAVELRAIVSARIERAFVEDGMNECALDHDIREAAQR